MLTEPQCVDVGGLTLSPRKWLVTDLDGVMSNVNVGGEKCDGILGAGLLDYYSAVIDFKGGLRLKEPPVLSEGRLEGDWVGQELRSEGVRYGSEFASPYRVSFHGGEMVLTRESFRTDYPFVTIATDQTPPQIDLTTTYSTVVRGVYEFNGEKLYLSIPMLACDDFYVRASSFEPGVGAKYTTLVLEKVPAVPK